ncbi:hypothetical protein AB0G04_13870 [Actinoplanes sp. NPDC023801]|uniref:hypothetical protein n=1 Tax=Actinoplanes sp. NPDC023801 TaxID=3154595 RepID=UPI0033D9C939
MFSLTGQIAAGGVGALLALSGLGAPQIESPTLKMPRVAPIAMTAGQVARFDLPVHNAGDTPVSGAVVSLMIDTERLVKTSYRNCSTGQRHLLCTFDTKLKPGGYYGLSEPLAFRPPADSITGSIVWTLATWWTATEYAALPTIPPESIPPGAGEYVWVSTPGPGWAAGSELKLKELAGPPAGPPEKVWDDYAEKWVDAESSLDLTVTRGRSADMEVSGVRSVLADGRGTLRASLINHGPGRLYPNSYLNNYLTISVTTPHHTRIMSAPERCLLHPDEGQFVECNSTASIGGGEREDFDLAVRVRKPTTDAGRIEILEDRGLDDPDQSNDTALIDITEPGLPSIRSGMRAP